jgi:hypothetical protein
MNETDKPFTVSDRRHFTADGRPREEETEPETPDVSPGESASAPRDESAAPPPGERPPTESSEPRLDDEGMRAAAGPADFSQFLLSLGAQASILLSGHGLPEDTDPKEALDGARSIISILEMLRDKTDGRRTKQEDEVIEGLLFELRMAYVEKTRAGGS